jgi:hypothetical protein
MLLSFRLGNCMLQVGTPDSVAESMLPSIVDPRDYDRLRFMQMNGGTGNSFEETIHRVSNCSILHAVHTSYSTNKHIYIN